MTSFTSFNINGKYQHGRRGNFEGEARVYEDSRFFAVMIDSGEDIIAQQAKLAIGFLKPNGGLSFIKLSPNHPIKPKNYKQVVYNLRQREFREFYGQWWFVNSPSYENRTFLEQIVGAPEVAQVVMPMLEDEEIKDPNYYLERLANIDAPLIKNLTPPIIEYRLPEPYNKFEGSLTLSQRL